MLKSVGLDSVTTGGPDGIIGDVVPLVDSKTGHMPTNSCPDPDQDEPSMMGKVS